MRVVDLFSGCGGLSLGFQQARHTIVAAFDNWEDAIKIYKANFNHPVFQQDLSDVDASVNRINPLHPDIIIGGPPCQDFSSAGIMNEDGGRGDLTIRYAQIISGVRPTWFLMENVSRITKTQKLIEAKEIFRNAGYGLTELVMDASYCGVPQKRKRYVLIGRINAPDNYMLSFLRQNLSHEPMTIAQYLPNFPIEFYYRHPRSYTRRGIYSVNEPSATIRGVNRPLPATYVVHPNDATQDLVGIRALTTRERSLIQTFPEDFNFIGSKSDIEQMVGNAVPVKLAKYWGLAISRCVIAERNNGGILTENQFAF